MKLNPAISKIQQQHALERANIFTPTSDRAAQIQNLTSLLSNNKKKEEL